MGEGAAQGTGRHQDVRTGAAIEIDQVPQVRESAADHRGGRHGAECGNGLNLAQALIVSEEERLVSPVIHAWNSDRTADGPPEHIAAILGLLGLVEICVRVQIVVAEVLPASPWN